MVRVRAAGAPVVGRAPARTEARSVVVPPGLPGHVVPDESWFRLEDPSLTAGGFDRGGRRGHHRRTGDGGGLRRR
ncbi:hypothetical protein ACWCQ0_36540 [Streptomyces massasporeus]|uniref:Uncharacterized protein n=1 Tax=Streptomyces massasporeus TaxID=67324 RepID=A0ABW6LIK3_9ACTN